MNPSKKRLLLKDAGKTVGNKQTAVVSSDDELRLMQKKMEMIEAKHAMAIVEMQQNE